MKLHRQQFRVQVNQMSTSQDRQRVAPRPVRVEDRCRLWADDTSAKRQRLMAGMPTLHQTDVNFNVDAHKMVVVAAMSDDQGEWTQRVIDWDKKYYGAKSGSLLDTQKVYEG